MKSGRHAKILEIISEHPVETQDEIITRLKEAGYKATQATISRDIKDLRLVKTLGSDGKYRYISAANRNADLRSSFAQLFSNSVVSIDCAQNLVVVKTLSGMANAVCAAMDSTGNAAIVGTIAGDDTFFVACRTSESAAELADYLKQYIIKH
ncbi:MAG: arginine repressor [Ruminococcus sp.]|nr:arginine repressor [Ruminococcus sp.]